MSFVKTYLLILSGQTWMRIYTPALQGFAFNLDTKAVLTLLKQLCLGTDTEVWIQNIRCGRAAMIALRNHYNGPDEARKRTLEAEAKLKNLFYKHEYRFPFERSNVPIATGVTAIDLDDGSTILLEAAQGLFFGSEMDRFLLNPNQLRAFGVAVCDDPTDKYQSLGIDLNDIMVPMKMIGSICGLISPCPTDEELESCRRF
ncbi:hypothetical protein CTEN210_18662 [Chaetoceros tenuissimus]|uniref:Uncharacterized protein n=1 Tax=Chaetoceros tenuissimus TaxID=426638 RepID=A0AAD3DD97_9STRA|nr:hypothetical protein CTEN210_18662 [Chaetoceros tenuissimus]